MSIPPPAPLPASLAVAQRSLGDPTRRYPLFPPLVEGCPATSTAELQYPLALDYDYARLPADFFDRDPYPGIRRWAELLSLIHISEPTRPY